MGACLGTAGLLMQGLVRNPLASPDVIGITGGASLAAVSFLALGGGAHWQRQRALSARNVLPFTVQASAGTLPGLVTATGEVDAVERVNVSPKRQGVIQALYVDEGMTVRAGQPLAVMDSSDLQDRFRLGEGYSMDLRIATVLRGLGLSDGPTGLTMTQVQMKGSERTAVVSGDPHVVDTLDVDGHQVTLRRHVRAFFQGNRFLLTPLVQHVIGHVGTGDRVVDLYAGTGLFSVSAAVLRGARYDVRIAESAQAALQPSILGGLDAVITDLRMPGQDGITPASTPRCPRRFSGRPR